jgi:hypothetical protein
VEVLSQPRSSLRFSHIIDKTSDPQAPEVSFDIENVGRKPVVAYTIRTALDCGESPTIGFELNNILSKAKMILPGQSVEHEFIGTECSKFIGSITLSIDFVEFADGKYWGEDTHKSRQKLAGMRAGARDETVAMNLIIKEQGAIAIANTAQDETNWIIPPNHTEEWIAGYKIGRNFRRSQIERAFSESGIQGAKDKLSQPYDASGKEKK